MCVDRFGTMVSGVLPEAVAATTPDSPPNVDAVLGIMSLRSVLSITCTL